MRDIIKKIIREYIDFEDGYDDDEYSDSINYYGKSNNKKTKIKDNFKNLVKDLNAKLVKDKINTYVFTLGPSKIYFKKTEKTNTIELDLIVTDENYKGKGFADKIMAEFLNVVDKYRMSVELSVVPRDKKTNYSKLVMFYKKFGFNKINDFQMFR